MVREKDYKIGWKIRSHNERLKGNPVRFEEGRATRGFGREMLMIEKLEVYRGDEQDKSRGTDKIRSLDASAARAPGTALGAIPCCQRNSCVVQSLSVPYSWTRVHNTLEDIYMCLCVHLCAYVGEKEKQGKSRSRHKRKRNFTNSQIWPCTFNRLTWLHIKREPFYSVTNVENK